MRHGVVTSARHTVGMDIVERFVGITTILQLSGDLVSGSCAHLDASVDRALRGGSRQILIDLTCARTIDAAGVGAIVRQWGAASARGALLCLFNPRRRVARLLTLARVTELIDTITLRVTHDACDGRPALRA